MRSIAYSHHECPCHLLCSLPCPPLHNILLVELAAAKEFIQHGCSVVGHDDGDLDQRHSDESDAKESDAKEVVTTRILFGG